MYIITNYAAITFMTNKTDIVYLLTAVCCIIIIIFFVNIHVLHELMTSGCSCLSSSENFYYGSVTIFHVP